MQYSRKFPIPRMRPHGAASSAACRCPRILAGRRLDQAAAALLPEFSRSRLSTWIDAGELTVGGPERAARGRCSRAARSSSSSTELEAAGEAAPEPIPLDVVHEDDALLVIDKPVGLVVHPGAGNRFGHAAERAAAPLPRARGAAARRSRPPARQGHERPAARRAHAHEPQRRSSRALERRDDQAHVSGGVPWSAHGRRQRRRADRPASARAHEDGRRRTRPRRRVTHYRVLERFRAHTLLRGRARDGPHASDPRAHGAHPRAAGRRSGLRRPAAAAARPERRAAPRALQGFKRQALHATRACACASGERGAARVRERARARSRARCSPRCAPTRPGARNERALRFRARLARAARACERGSPSARAA